MQGVSKSDSQRRIRKRLARRLRVGTAIALLTLAGCTDNAGPAEAKKAAEATAPSTITVKLDPLGGIRASDASLLAALIEERAMQPDMPFAADTKHAYAIGGAVDAGPAPTGTYLVAVLDIHSADGVSLHRIVEDSFIAQPRGMAPTRADLTRIASDAVSKLAAWHMASFGAPHIATALAPSDIGPDDNVAADAGDDDFATGSIAQSVDAASAGGRLHVDIDMAPAPGDGREALARALGDALSRRAPTSQWSEGHYLLRGEVMAAATGGEPGLSIRWQVMGEDGHVIGTVTQVNAASPSSVAFHWGPLAGEAAEAAASGVLAVLARPANGA